MNISIIAACSRNRTIGVDNRLPWKLPEDLARFKRLTLDHCLVMGRKTFESIGRPLPRRRTIVVTRGAATFPAGVIVAHSLDEAFELAARGGGDRDAAGEVFIAGGAEIYRQTLDRASRLYLTLVDAEVPGDTFFPAFDASAWRETERVDHPATNGGYAFSFVTYDRVVALSASP